MAKSGSFSKTFSTGYTLKVAWSESNVDTANNQSDITCKVTLSASGSYYISSSASKNISLTINGTKYTSTCTVGISAGSSKTLMTKTVSNINHSSDGSKSISISCTLNIDVTLGGSYVDSVTTSGTATLTTIARASTITSAGNVTLGNACSVKWTPASTSFYYKLKFSLGTWSHTTGAIHPNTTSTYTYTGYTIPLADSNEDVAGQLPKSTTGTMTVYLYTYSNSACTTKIGSTSSKTFTVTVPSTVIPTISSSSITKVNSNSVIAGWDVAVAGYTKIQVKASASGKYKSTISSFTISGGYSTTKNGTSLDYTGDKITSSGTKTFYVVAKDSRGRSSSKATAGSVTFYSYSKPSISSFKASRTSSDKSKVSVKGAWTYSSINGNNSVTATVYYKKGTETEDSYKSAGTISNNTSKTLSIEFDETSSYDFKLIVKDSLSNTSTYYSSISTTAVLLDFRAGGKGLGIGKFAETDAMEVGMKSKFSKHMYFENGVGIYGTLTDGTFNEMLSMSSSNNTIVGYDGYVNANGKTHIYGNDVKIFSAAAGNVNYCPYLRADDVINFPTIYTAGFVTGSKTSICFFVPVSRPIIGSPTVSIASTEGIIIRQDGNYTHGSSSDGYVKPSSYVGYIRQGGVVITATMSDTTNAINNAPCGVTWSGIITLS